MRAAAALALLLAAGCAAGRAAQPSTLARAQELFSQGRHGYVVVLLSDRELRSMRSRDQARGYELLGQSQEALGETDGALRTYQVGVAQFPKDVSLLTRLGNLLHRGGLDEEARPFYVRILALSPSNAAAHLGLAQTESRLGFFARAASHYVQALQSWGDQPALWLEYAQVLSGTRRDAEALDAIGRALALADSAPARIAQARALWRLGRKPEAFEALGRADRFSPDQLGLLWQRALWQLEAGDLEHAAAAAAAALKLSPDDPLAFWARASVALRRGKTPDARRDLEKAAGQRTAPFVAEAAAAMLKELR